MTLDEYRAVIDRLEVEAVEAIEARAAANTQRTLTRLGK